MNKNQEKHEICKIDEIHNVVAKMQHNNKKLLNYLDYIKLFYIFQLIVACVFICGEQNELCFSFVAVAI